MVRQAMDQPRRLILPRLVDERGHQRLARAALGIGGALFLLSAEAALYHASVLAGKRHAQSRQPPHDLRRVGRQPRHRVRVGKVAAAAHGIGKVLLPGIALAHRIERGIDAALGEHGLRPLRRLLRDKIRWDSPLRERDRRGESGKAGSDDSHHTFHRK